MGQLAGLGPQVALVSKYDPHPIVDDMKGTATGFPLSRSLTIKNTDKTNVQKLFESSDSSFATTTLNSPSVNPNDPKNKKGPMTIAAAGTYTTGKENSEGRFVVVGTSSWAANSFIGFNGNSDLALNAMNWLSSDEDLISIRPKAPEDRTITMTQGSIQLGPAQHPVSVAGGAASDRRVGLVAEKIAGASDRMQFTAGQIQ